MKTTPQQKTLTYIALLDEDQSPGVAQKITNTVHAAKKIGIDAKKNIHKKSVIGALELIINIATQKSEILIIRFSDLIAPAAFFPLALQRLRGKKIIIDVPTPRSVGLKEIETLVKNPVTRFFRKAYNYFSASWVLMPANTVIQYAEEGAWFRIGTENKTIKMGNGITIDESIPIINSARKSQTLNLIAVAQLADWHGYDRIIKAIDRINKSNHPKKITLTIVGDGEALDKLKNLAKDLSLTNINFTGRLTGKDLDNAFEGKHIGVSSLGLYRKGLQEASDLKTREYMARGLCVIGTGRDPDFDDNSPYRFLASNEDEIESLVKILCSFESKEIPSPNEARNYAKSRLTLESKISLIIEKSTKKNP